MNTNSPLYKFCLSVHKTNDYSNFFKELEKKLEKEMKIREKEYSIKHSLEKKYSSNMKIKGPSRLFFKEGGNVMKRYKTEHNRIPTT